MHTGTIDKEADGGKMDAGTAGVGGWGRDEYQHRWGIVGEIRVQERWEISCVRGYS